MLEIYNNCQPKINPSCSNRIGWRLLTLQADDVADHQQTCAIMGENNTVILGSCVTYNPVIVIFSLL
jgi:hypothetical protein